MCKGHNDAQYYRFDFAKVVIDEMLSMAGVKEESEEDNETKMKRLFDGN